MLVISVVYISTILVLFNVRVTNFYFWHNCYDALNLKLLSYDDSAIASADN